MKLHRFFVSGVHDKAGQLQLKRQVWIHDPSLLNQWLRVLRFKAGDQLILFDENAEKIYKIVKVEYPNSVLLEEVTELVRQLPKKHVYLLWSSLKKDNNYLVIQKATELGAKNLVPIISDRSEKEGLNIDRARKIIIEAVEQCGRGDIPDIREPITLPEALQEYAGLPLFVCEQGSEATMPAPLPNKFGILIGPEGGWSDAEKALFAGTNMLYIALADYTLRAETAAIVALAKLQNV